MEDERRWAVIPESLLSMQALKAYIYVEQAEGILNDLPLYLRMSDQFQIIKLKDFCEKAMILVRFV